MTGLYIHGGVGCGKTMLMDLFFDTVQVRRKRRVHFNSFMADVHDRIQKHRQARKNGTAKEDDPIPQVARALAEEAWLLCLDEFDHGHADAMILSRLFARCLPTAWCWSRPPTRRPTTFTATGSTASSFSPSSALLKRHATVIAARFRHRLQDGEAEPDAGIPDAAVARRPSGSWRRPGKR